MVPFHFVGEFFVFWGDVKGGLWLFFSTIYNLLGEMSIIFHLGGVLGWAFCGGVLGGALR